MRKDIRFTICLVAIILLALLCIYSFLADKEEEGDKKPGDEGVTVVPTQRVIILPNGDDKNLVLDTVRYYTVKLSSRKIESVEAAVGQGVEVSPKLISEYITDSLEDEEIDLNILGIEQKDGVCIIDFDDEIVKIAKKDPNIEKLILDAYSMSIVDNCSDVDGVSFRINGKAYRTDNLTLKDQEVYLKK